MVSDASLWFIGKGCFVSFLVAFITAVTRLQTTEASFPVTEVHSTCFTLSEQPDPGYTSLDILFIPHNCTSVADILELSNCTLKSNISELSSINFASINSAPCYIRKGSSLKSSGPVDVFIRLHSVLLRVPPINQRANSYLFRPLNQTRNEICEKLFIYAVNDSATLNICSNEFLQINMSSLSDRDIIRQEVSRKCFKKTVSLGDGLLLSGLSRIRRLQITSDQPFEILYGLGKSSAANQSSRLTNESGEGLTGWHIRPISSMMGKLFVIVPGEKSKSVQINIIGFYKTMVRMQTAENDTAYNVTKGKTLTITLRSDETVVVEAGANIIVQVTFQQINQTLRYFAEPLNQLDPTCLNHSKIINYPEDKNEFDRDEIGNPNFTAICTDQNVKITSESTSLKPLKVESYAIFGNKSIFIYYFELSSKNIYQIKYPKSKCFIPSNSLLMIRESSGGTDKSVLVRNFTVINLQSVLESARGSTERQDTSLNDQMGSEKLKHSGDSGDSGTKTPLFNIKGLIKTESKLSELLKLTTVKSTLRIDDSFHQAINKRPQMDNDSSSIPVSTASAMSDNVVNAFEAATAELFLFNVNKESGVSGQKVPTTPSTLGTIHYPMQDIVDLPTDINEGFKIAVDLVQLDENARLKSGNENPPYVVNSDVFVSVDSELDARNSMAVIISLCAALAAVMLVILVFFLTEVFSKRRNIRHMRIRPSRSFY